MQYNRSIPSTQYQPTNQSTSTISLARAAAAAAVVVVAPTRDFNYFLAKKLIIPRCWLVLFAGTVFFVVELEDTVFFTGAGACAGVGMGFFAGSSSSPETSTNSI